MPAEHGHGAEQVGCPQDALDTLLSNCDRFTRGDRPLVPMAERPVVDPCEPQRGLCTGGPARIQQQLQRQRTCQQRPQASLTQRREGRTVSREPRLHPRSAQRKELEFADGPEELSERVAHPRGPHQRTHRDANIEASEVETPQAFEEDVRRELRGVRRLVEGVEKEPEGTLAAAPLIELRSGEQSVDREATLAIGAQASHRDPTPTS
ncbi:MAG: hypothetical protein IPF99_36740 [Deltaproteobacteria bacterium]|nr:hypothetical protein [Deltaproteobacteria bacterium]